MTENTNSSRMLSLPEDIVVGLLNNSAEELKRSRHSRILGRVWKIVMVVGFFAAAYFIGASKVSPAGNSHEPHIAYVEVYGPIMSGQFADADRLIPALHKAFDDNMAKAVVLRINSPGGSPVHAGRLYKEIKTLREQYPEKHIYAVIEDLGASAAYYIASATDEIYVDQASIVGSIGVVTSSFGFSEIMNKVGVERRVLTAGENKALLDPFLPLDPKVKVHWQTMLDNIHDQFILAVKEGRNGKLDDAGPEVFSGMVWTGEDSVKIGLADGTGSLMSVSRDTLGKVNTVNYTPAPDLFKRLANGTQAALTSMQIQMSAPSLY